MPLRNVSDQSKTQIKIDGKNTTKTHLSTNIIIAVNGMAIGAIKKLTIKESRPIQQMSEVGTDGIIDSAPSKSTEISGDCQRIRYDGKRMAEAFKRGYIHLHSQRVPFDIEIYDIVRGDANNIVLTVIENVWMSDLSVDYDSENFIIQESMSWKAESINTVLAQTNDSAIYDPRSVFMNSYEREADIGIYRGALDAAGLLNSYQGSLGELSYS